MYARQNPDLLDKLHQMLRVNAALVLLPPDVHLYQHIHRQAISNTEPRYLPCQLHTVHRLDTVHLAYQILYLICLQLSDKLQVAPAFVKAFVFVQELLYTVFAKACQPF